MAEGEDVKSGNGRTATYWKNMAREGIFTGSLIGGMRGMMVDGIDLKT